MTPIEELQAQREAVLNGKWVQRGPKREREACLLQRWTTAEPVASLSLNATRYLAQALDVHPVHPWEPLTIINDRVFASRDDAIAALDEAIRLAKEDAA
jgi:hypothetical protein